MYKQQDDASKQYQYQQVPIYVENQPPYHPPHPQYYQQPQVVYQNPGQPQVVYQNPGQPQVVYQNPGQPQVLLVAPGSRRRLSVVGIVAIIVLLLIFWPLCWIPCVMEDCYEEY
eukprot:TRINITY_DN13594_c0_g1_i1.p2 TRINITY_DN13594_c0_g1~~TRINITY_DN13594_c0_g1_i1.p2  ORF type:complete len:114 (-),score=16.07 TRINITY_DN13594_c0_g1_i1:118-459(-)